MPRPCDDLLCRRANGTCWFQHEHAGAIGGITAHNAHSLVEAGADMLAVVHGVFGQPDCETRAREISRLYDDGEYLSGT